MWNNTNQRRLGGSFAALCLGIGTLCLALAGSADGQEKPKKLTDAEITRLLAGKWSMQTSLKELDPKLKDLPDVKITVALRHNKDGTFEVAMTNVAGTLTTKETFEGTWKVAEGVLEKTLTKVNSPSNPKMKVGDKGKERIILINEMTLTTQNMEKQGEKAMTFKRVKD
jgi:hypothetical protein